MRLIILCTLACIFTGCSVPETPSSTNFLHIAAESGYEFAPVSRMEQSLIGTLLRENEESPLQSVVLMKAGDRVAAVWWQERENPEMQLASLKRSIFPLLSGSSRELIDDIDVFSFSDAEVNEEKLLFAATENLLMEFHMHKDVQILMEMLILRLNSP